MCLLLHSKLILQRQTRFALCSLLGWYSKVYLSVRTAQISRNTDVIYPLRWLSLELDLWNELLASASSVLLSIFKDIERMQRNHCIFPKFFWFQKITLYNCAMLRFNLFSKAYITNYLVLSVQSLWEFLIFLLHTTLDFSFSCISPNPLFYTENN